MILLENCVPPVYVDESRDFQFFLRAFNVIFNMVKEDINTLTLITNTKECETRILPLLKTKLGFFTNYDMDDTMLRWILRGFPYMVKNKGSLESIKQAVYIFLKALNIKTRIIIKAIGDEDEVVEGGIHIDNHTILIAIESAVQNFYVLEELFRYIMPVGYQYSFYFYKKIEDETWLVNRNTGKFLIVSTLITDSIRSYNLYNQDVSNKYSDPEIDKLVNQVNLMNVNNNITDTNQFTMVRIDIQSTPTWFKSYYYYLYRIEDDKYVQLRQGETYKYQPETYYIPRFFFINDEDYWYELLTEDPTFDYMGTQASRLYWEWYNYYTRDNDGKFRNLQGPASFVENTYYKVKDSLNENSEHIRVFAEAENVKSYTAIPLTSQFILMLTEVAQAQ